MTPTAGDGANPGVRHRLFWALSAQGVALALRILLQIALVPILLTAWDTDRYAQWILIYSAAASLSLFDLGIQFFFGNAMLIAQAKGDSATARRHFGVAMTVYAGILAFAAGLVLIGGAIVTEHGDFVPEALRDPETQLSFAALAAATLLMIPFGVVTAIYRAHGDYARASVIGTSAEAVRELGVCAVALMGGGIAGASLCYFGIAAALWIGVAADQRRLYGRLPLVFSIPSRRELREGALGSALYLAPTLAMPVALNCPIILLGALGAPSSAIIAFSVYRTFTGFARQFVHMLSHPLGAELARQQAAGNAERLRNLFQGAGRLLSGLAGLLTGVTLIAAEPFLRIWTNGQTVFDVWLLIAFLGAIVALTPGQVALLMVQYNNQARVLAVSYTAYGFLAALLVALLAVPFSARGAAVGVGLAEVLSLGILVPREATRSAGVALMAYFRKCAAVALLGLGLGWSVAALLSAIIVLDTLTNLAAMGVLWSGLVVGPALYLLLARAERDWLLQMLRRASGPPRNAGGSAM